LLEAGSDPPAKGVRNEHDDRDGKKEKKSVAVRESGVIDHAED